MLYTIFHKHTVAKFRFFGVDGMAGRTHEVPTLCYDEEDGYDVRVLSLWNTCVH